MRPARLMNTLILHGKGLLKVDADFTPKANHQTELHYFPELTVSVLHPFAGPSRSG
jgi:hypothetical protein